jgi:hypothetical protein
LARRSSRGFGWHRCPCCWQCWRWHFYLCYTVPTKLDDVLSNQQVIQKKVGEIEDKVMEHDVRLIKLELRR